MAMLVAGVDGSLVDPSDREAVINAAEAVPGIEDSDINDGWLIEHTQNLNAGPGMMKYSIVLPDGLPFECTPFLMEHRRDMSKMWMAAVRQEIINRASAASEITRAANLKAKRDKQMQGAGIQVVGQMPTAEEVAVLAAAVKQAPPPPPESAREILAVVKSVQTDPSPSTDPIEYASQQLEKAEAEYAHWQSLESKASKNKKAAQKAALKWKTVLEAFSEDEPEPAPVAVPSVGTRPLTRAEKAARTLQTSIVTRHI